MIGVGIITCDRLDFFEKCLASIPFDRVDYVVVVNDGAQWIDDKVPDELKPKIYCIQHTGKPRQGVAVSKNQALQYLMEKDCDYLFLIEDDIIVIDPNVFEYYIDAHKETGIEHFMFGYHGPANKTGSNGTPKPKHKIRYKDHTILLNEHCVGAFIFYTHNCINKCGLLDIRYYNAFEHVDHSYKIALHGLTTPYWNWADVDVSWGFLGEQACSEENSSIRGHEGWKRNIEKGYKQFIKNHGYAPFGQGCVRDTLIDEIKPRLKELYDEKHRVGN